MKRHACLILAHAHFNQLKTLVRLLDDARNDIFIHVDARARDFDPGAFDGICKASKLTFIKPRIAIHWGGISIMRAELALLKEACRGTYTYYHLLSGMDLPIKSQNEIHAFFEAHEGKEFLDLWQFKSHTHRRFHYYTLFPEGAGSFIPNLANNLFKGLQMLVGPTINRKIDFRFASQWFSITDACARYVLSQEDWLEKVFRHTNTADEIFLPTLLWNSPFKECLYDKEEHVQNSEYSHGNMRLIDWSRGESVRHPWTFKTGDYDLLINAPQLWARKFDDSVDAGIIERIARELAPSSDNTR